MGGVVSVPKAGNNPLLDRKSYVFGPIIGSGGYSMVRVAEICVHHTKYNLAMKELCLRDIGKSELERERGVTTLLDELKILKLLGRHPSLPRVLVAFRDHYKCYLGLNLLEGGDLRFHMQEHSLPLTLRDCAYFVACIGSALHHIHCRNILHRDIKPENVMLTASGVPVLTDFGVSYYQEPGTIALCESSSGTQPYLAPEVLTLSHCHSYQSDYWSLGILAYEITFGTRPFEKHCDKQMIYFVDNHYRSMWDRVKDMNVSGTNAMLDIVDWEDLAKVDEETRTRNLTFPRHDIPLSASGDVPSELKISIPDVSCHGEIVSSACKNLIGSLLDVRIPKRLGVSSNFFPFCEHEWFEEQHIVFSGGVCVATPTLIPDVSKVVQYLGVRYAERNFLSHIGSDFQEIDDDSPVQMDKSLDEFVYFDSNYFFGKNESNQIPLQSSAQSTFMSETTFKTEIRNPY